MELIQKELFAVLVDEEYQIVEVKAVLNDMIGISMEMLLLFKTPYDELVDLEDEKVLADYHIDDCFNKIWVCKAGPTMQTLGRAYNWT